MENDNYKDVEIGEHRYRIGRFTARVGSRVLTQVLLKGMTGALTDDEFYRLQTTCLNVIQRYDPATGAPMPITHSDTGAFVAKELEYDLSTVFSLSLHVLSFNIGPFMSQNGLGTLMNQLGLNLPSMNA